MTFKANRPVGETLGSSFRAGESIPTKIPEPDPPYFSGSRIELFMTASLTFGAGVVAIVFAPVEVPILVALSAAFAMSGGLGLGVSALFVNDRGLTQLETIENLITSPFGLAGGAIGVVYSKDETGLVLGSQVGSLLGFLLTFDPKKGTTIEELFKASEIYQAGDTLRQVGETGYFTHEREIDYDPMPRGETIYYDNYHFDREFDSPGADWDSGGDYGSDMGTIERTG
ncbi:MAG: hypothetical protein AB7S71_24770 [Dongiaceae bacterium]